MSTAAMSVTFPFSELRAPDAPAAPWLAAVERRIQKSILPIDREYENDGRWLSQTVVNSAMAYFRKVSDLIPIEPYIYGAAGGGLIAEFRAAHGRIVTIVKNDTVQIVTVLDGQPMTQPPTVVWAENFGALRKKIKEQMQLVSQGDYGEVEARSR